MEINPLFVLFGTFIFLLVGGVPIAFSMGLASIVTFVMGDIPLIIFPQYLYDSLYSFPLLAVPLFVAMGAFMEGGDITQRLIRITNAFLGRFRGGLGYVNVAVSMLFAGMSGSAVADTSSVGSVIIPAMIRDGYSRGFTVALTAASSTIGSIIPPSLFMIVVGAFGDISITALFMGGIIPGILVGIGQMIIVFLYTFRTHENFNKPKISVKEKVSISIKGFPAFLIPVIVIGGILTGVFTATESAAVAVIYVLFVNFVIYRSMNLNSFLNGLINTGKIVGPIIFCVANASIFGWLLAYYEVSTLLNDYAQALNVSPAIWLVLIAIFFIIIGTVEAAIASIIIFFPMIKTLALAAGIHPVHLGVVVTMCLAVGLITPPYALCLLTACKFGEIGVIEALRHSLIFLLFFILVIFACIWYPDLVLFVPKLLVPQFM